MGINGRMVDDSPLLSCGIAAHTCREAVIVPNGWCAGLKLSTVGARMFRVHR